MKIVAGLVAVVWLVVGVYSFRPLASGETSRAVAQICLVSEQQKSQGILERLKEFGLPSQPTFDCDAFERDTYRKAFIYTVLALAGIISALLAIFNSKRRTAWLLISALIYLLSWAWKVAGKDIIELYRVMFALENSASQFFAFLGIEVLAPLIFIAVSITCIVTLMHGHSSRSVQ